VLYDNCLSCRHLTYSPVYSSLPFLVNTTLVGFSILAGDRRYLLLWRGQSPAIKFYSLYTNKIMSTIEVLRSPAVVSRSPAVLEIENPALVLPSWKDIYGTTTIGL